MGKPGLTIVCTLVAGGVATAAVAPLFPGGDWISPPAWLSGGGGGGEGSNWLASGFGGGSGGGVAGGFGRGGSGPCCAASGSTSNSRQPPVKAPEPGTLMLLGFGVIALKLIRKRE